MKISPYGTLPDGRAVTRFTLTGAGGAEAEILDYGGVIRALRVPDRAGRLADVAMGFETLADQLSRPGWNCGIVGRCVNRVGGGKLWIHGAPRQLDIAPGAPFVLHGGAGNYAARLFHAEAWADAEGETLRLYLRDRGEGSFPGVCDVWVTYILTPENELQIRYRALPEEDTVLNLTSHCYFNLSGHGGGVIHNHFLRLDSEFYLPAAPGGLPTGEVLRVRGTAFDFTEPRRLGAGLESGDAQIALQGGYDHNFCLSGGGYRAVGFAYDERSGRKMTVLTDMPGVQLYVSGNETPGAGFKDGARYGKYHALCLETQYFPDATARSHFPQPVFPADRIWRSQTAYRFSAE